MVFGPASRACLYEIREEMLDVCKTNSLSEVETAFCGPCVVGKFSNAGDVRIAPQQGATSPGNLNALEDDAPETPELCKTPSPQLHSLCSSGTATRQLTTATSTGGCTCAQRAAFSGSVESRDWRPASVYDAGYISAPLPPDEVERLATLQSYQIMDTARDDRVLDSITRMLATTLGVEISLVSLIDQNRQWFKSAIGLEAPETERDAAFCAWTIIPEPKPEPYVLVIEDTLQDRRFCRNPLVEGAPNIRFYAGVQLVAPNMQRLGSLCAISSKPRTMAPHELDLLRSLGSMVMMELELRRRTSFERTLAGLPHNIQTRKALQRLSHELRTPLHGVLGSLELALALDLPPESRVCVQDAFDGASSLKAVVDQLSMASSSPEHNEARAPQTPSGNDSQSQYDVETRRSEPAESTSKSCGSVVASVPSELPSNTPSTSSRDDFSATKVLIVDDEPLNLRLLERQLKRMHVTAITTATNGVEAVQADAAAAFDIIICDLQMPLMGGTEAIATIVRRYPQPGRVLPYLVALTADATEGVSARCAMAGFHLTLTKPADVSVLQRTLQSMLAYKKALAVS